MRNGLICLLQIEAEEQQYVDMLNKKYGDDGEGWYVRYVQNTSTGTWSPMFYISTYCCSSASNFAI